MSPAPARPWPPASTGGASPRRTKVCGSAGPRSTPSARVGVASNRTAVTRARRRSWSRAAWVSASAAPGRRAAVQASAGARGAEVNAVIPPGWWAIRSASPFSDSAHSAAPGGSCGPRSERNNRLPSAVKTGAKSPGTDPATRRASRSPAGSTSHNSDTYRVPSSSRVWTDATRRVPSGARARSVRRGCSTRRWWKGLGALTMVIILPIREWVPDSSPRTFTIKSTCWYRR